MQPEQEALIHRDDSLTEAARVVIMANFAVLLREESTIHDADLSLDVICASARRSYYLLSYLSSYYDSQVIQPFLRELVQINGVLDHARLHRNLVYTMQQYQKQLDDEEDIARFQSIIERTGTRVRASQRQLSKQFRSDSYAEFVQSFTDFLLTDKAGLAEDLDPGSPYTVGHLAPMLIHQQLAKLRAAEQMILSGSADVLLDVRQTTLDLLDILIFFEPVLGAPIQLVLPAIDALVQPLQQIQFTIFSEATLTSIHRLRKGQVAVLNHFLDMILADVAQAFIALPLAWGDFHSQVTYENLHKSFLPLYT